MRDKSCADSALISMTLTMMMCHRDVSVGWRVRVYALRHEIETVTKMKKEGRRKRKTEAVMTGEMEMDAGHDETHHEMKRRKKKMLKRSTIYRHERLLMLLLPMRSSGW